MELPMTSTVEVLEMDQFDFTGKKAVVTGASSGVGRETAVLLSRAGARVIVLARREEELKKTVSMMEGEGHAYRVIDVSRFDDVVDCMKEIVAEDGKKIDCIAHCAGVAVPTPLRSMSGTALDGMMWTNFYSFAAILKCAAMKKLFQDSGAIVGVSSLSSVFGHRANGIYSATKGAMDAMMRSAARELSPRGIRVNTICPNGIRTEMVANLAYKSTESSSVDDLPDSLLLPEKVASVIVALLSDSMQYISGVTLNIDRAQRWND